MSKNSSVDIGSLFSNARQDGAISKASENVLTAPDIGLKIGAGLGIGVDDVQASEVVLLTMLIDDSGSISGNRNEQIVRDGHNLVIDSIKASKSEDNVLAHTCYINGTTLFEYRLIGSAEAMNAKNYMPNGMTPLYESSIVTLGRVLAKAQEFLDQGVPVRTITLIMTDGASNDNKKTADEVKTIVTDMLKSEVHIISGMGINDGYTDFKQIFSDMGIRDEWILTPSNSSSEIRKAFQVFSRSAVKASQNAATFSTAFGGGFGGSNFP